MPQVTYSLKIDTETDGDLVRWLGQQDNKSQAIREALRGHIRGSGVSLGDVYQAVVSIERQIKAGVIVQSNPGDGAILDEPPEAAAALDALARL